MKRFLMIAATLTLSLASAKTYAGVLEHDCQLLKDGESIPLTIKNRVELEVTSGDVKANVTIVGKDLIATIETPTMIASGHEEEDEIGKSSVPFIVTLGAKAGTSVGVNCSK